MANTIRLKRSTGNTAPSSLAQGEPAYVEQQGTGDGRLYIGVGGAGIEEIGGKFYVDLLNSYDTDLGTFSLPANTTITTFGASFVGSATSAAATAQLDLATITAKGLVPTLPNNASVFFDGTGNFSTPAGGGDVSFNAGVAPVDNAITRFDGVSGTIIQESGVTISDADDIVTGGTVEAAGFHGDGVTPVTYRYADGGGTGPTVLLNSTNVNLNFANVVRYQFTNTSFLVDSNISTFRIGSLSGVGDRLVTANTSGDLQEGVITIDTTTTLGTSDTALPTQNAVKTYVDNATTSALTYRGAFDPTANAGNGSPDLDTITSETGDFYTVTVAGTYNFTTGSAVLEVGDSLIAEADGVLNNVNQWTIVQNNLQEANQTTPGYVSVGAQTFGGTKTFEDIAGTDAGATIDSFVIDGGTF